MFEISTDKVDAEIPSPASGVLLEIKAEEGATVPVNDVVALIGEEGEGSDGSDGGDEAPSSEEAPPEESVAEASEQETAGEADAEDGEAADPEEGDDEASPAKAAGDGSEADRVRQLSSPVVRKMAEAEGVDLSEVEGTGIHGRVTKRDLEAYLESRDRGTPAETEKAAAASMPAADEAQPTGGTELVRTPRRAEPEGDGFFVPAYTEGENVEIEPMSRIRQITAAHMRYSKDTSAHVTTVFHMDLSRVHRARQNAKSAFQRAHGTKLTYMPFVFKAVATALKAHPKVNAAIDGTDVVFKKDINIGMAVALDWGLLVPVIRNADQLNLVGLAKTANDLADRARSKKLSPDELKGGTFTVTNPGVFGSLFGTPIINQPQVAILGLGTIEKRPVVVTDAEGNDTIVIKPMAYFAITYDHRLVDGADADHFMNHIKKTLVEETWSELDF